MSHPMSGEFFLCLPNASSIEETMMKLSSKTAGKLKEGCDILMFIDAVFSWVDVMNVEISI